MEKMLFTNSKSRSLSAPAEVTTDGKAIGLQSSNDLLIWLDNSFNLRLHLLNHVETLRLKLGFYFQPCFSFRLKKIKSFVATFGRRGSSVHAWLCSLSPCGCRSSPAASQLYHGLQSSSWHSAGSNSAICSFRRQFWGFSQHTSVFLLKGKVPDCTPLIPRTYLFSIPKAQTEIEKRAFGICPSSLEFASTCF